MARVSLFENECSDGHKVKIEVDDVFDESVEKKLKTENDRQVQFIENDDAFDEAFEKQADLSSHNTNLENKLTVTVKCLCKEEDDDVFDEEGEKVFAKCDAGSVNIDARIKLENEVYDHSYAKSKLQENLGPTANVLKMENDPIFSTEELQGFKALLTQNIIIDDESFMEIDEKKIKVEVEIESEVTRIKESTQKSNFEEDSLLHEVKTSAKDERSAGTGIEIERNNDFEIIQTSNNVDSGEPEPSLKTLMETLKQTKANKIKLKEQNRDSGNVNSRDKEKVPKEDEMDSFKSIKRSTRKPSDRDKQQTEYSTNSYSKNSKEKKMGNYPEISENIINPTHKEDNIEKTAKDLAQNIISNNKASNTGDKDTTKDCILYQKKSGKENELLNKTVSSGWVPNETLNEEGKTKLHRIEKTARGKIRRERLNEKKTSESVLYKMLTGEEKTKHHGQQSPKIITANAEKQTKIHKMVKHSEPITTGKENVKEMVTDTMPIDEDKKNETHSRTEIQKCKNPLDSSNQKKTKTNTLVSNNLPTIKELRNNDTIFENIEYCCTKCSFRTQHITIFKTHLTKHGTKFFSGVISFLDLVNNEEVVASQCESEQVQDEIKIQGTNNTIYKEAQIEDKLENDGEVDACKSSQSNCQVTDKNGNRGIISAANQQNEILNIENNAMGEKNETIALDKENENILAPPTNVKIISNSENQIVQNEDSHIVNKNISSEMELVGSDIQNKNKEDNQSKICAVSNEVNNTVIIVNDVEKEEETQLQFNKNEETIKAVTNVESKSESIENLITQSQCNQVSKPKAARLKSNKRKRVRKSRSPSKKLKLGNDGMYHCDECSYRSHTKRYLDMHRIIHSKDVIKCKHCPFTTNLERYLTSHMLVHLQPEEVKMHKCPHCSYQSKRRGDLGTHMVLHKKPEQIKMFQCDKCSYKTKRNTNLRSHELIHKSVNDVVMFSCADCSYAAKNKHTLKSHMIVHQRMEQIHWHKCGQCSYTTKYKAGLKRHSLVHKDHDEITTYDCPICFYQAKHKSHLKVHLLIHMDPKEVKMHHCNHCSYKSIKKSNLMSHMLQHKRTEEINMKKCGQCPYQTKLKCNLLKHISRIHDRAIV